jgi:ribonuclease HII
MYKDTKYIIGIDEVGRGPIAGPVAVCAFLMKDESFLNLSTISNGGKSVLPKLRDSKKLSKKQREVWFEFLKKEKEKGNCDFAVSFVSSENIDKFGIAKCIQKALNQSLEKITPQNYLNFCPCRNPLGLSDEDLNNSVDPSCFYKIVLDGGLHAPKEFVNQETIIKGDELHPVISLASIVAKVSRDAVMTKYAKVYPEYGFEKHMGYGTKAHYEAIKKYGQTSIHRKSFIH